MVIPIILSIVIQMKKTYSNTMSQAKTERWLCCSKCSVTE
nr:MAG TPA: hypothetical protein [Caudoviricetes sp.]